MESSNSQSAYRELLSIYKGQFAVKSREDIFHIIGLFQQILSPSNSPEILTIIYNNFLSCHLFKENSCDFIKHKIAFICHKIHHFIYYLNIIQNLSPLICDIIIIDIPGIPNQDLHGLKEKGFNIYYGLETIASYPIVVIDVYKFVYFYTKFNIERQSVIILTHSLAQTIYKPYGARLAILPYENYCYLGHRPRIEYFDQKNLNLVQSLPLSAKCEFAFTGPYHINETYLRGKSKPLSVEKLQNETGRIIPRDRPIVLVVEDWVMAAKQIVYLANKLATNFTVIFRPYFVKELNRPSFINRLNPNVIIYDKEGMGYDLARFSANFIVCGIMGSFFSSIMLGIPVLPIRSRIIVTEKGFNPNTASFQKVLNMDLYYNRPDFKWKYPNISKVIAIWPNIYDVIDVTAVRLTFSLIKSPIGCYRMGLLFYRVFCPVNLQCL